MDPKGIAKIEQFLDIIEDNDEDIIDNFQKHFPSLLDVYGEAGGSEDFTKNKRKSKCWIKDRGVVDSRGKTNDGYLDCVHKGELELSYTYMHCISSI